MFSNNNNTDFLSRIEAMRAQEDATSSCYNYLESSSRGINLASRTSMVQWCQQVQKALKLSSETSWIAISFFDRYLSSGKGRSQQALQDRYKFQLAAVTSFYTAVKMNETRELNAVTLAKLCQGYYKVSDILSMEEDILFALDWRVSNSHTPMEFVRQLIELLPVKYNSSISDSLLEACRNHMDHTITDFYFTFCKPSVVGASCLASVLTQADILSTSERQAFWLQLTDLTDLIGVMEAQSKLLQGKSKVSKKPSSLTSKSSTFSQPKRVVADGKSSPVCVSKTARQA